MAFLKALTLTLILCASICAQNSPKVFNVKSYGAAGNGSTDDRAALNNANTAAAVSGGTVYFPVGTYRVASALSFSSNVTLQFDQGALLAPAAAVTVTITGGIAAEPVQIFSGSGAVSFASNTSIPIYQFKWWGTTCNNAASNNATALQAAIDAIPNNSRIEQVQGCTSYLSSTVNITDRFGLYITSGGLDMENFGGSPPTNVGFIWNGTGGTMWAINHSDRITFYGLNFQVASGKTVDTFLDWDGDPGTHIGTMGRVYRSSLNASNGDPNANFVAISISRTTSQNHENFDISYNDFGCSTTRTTLRSSQGGSLTSGSTTVTCTDCAFVSGDVGQRIRVSYATGILDTTIQSVTDGTHVVVTGIGATSNQTGCRVHTGTAYGTAIRNGNSFNAKHQQFNYNRVTWCAIGIDVVKGSFDAAHLGGFENDIDVRVSTTSESSVINFLETEGALQGVNIPSTTGLDLKIINSRISNFRALSNGYYYIQGAVVIDRVIQQDTQPTNSVIVGASGTLNLNSRNNEWFGPTATEVGYQALIDSIVSNVPSATLTVENDVGMSDMPYRYSAGVFAATNGSQAAFRSSNLTGAPFPAFSTILSTIRAGSSYANDAFAYKATLTPGGSNSSSMYLGGVDISADSTSRNGNFVGVRWRPPTVVDTPAPESNGFWVRSPAASTLITNNYGVRVDSQANNTGTNYAFKSFGAADIVSIAGPVYAQKEIRTNNASNTDLAGQLTVGGGGTVSYTFTQTYTSAPVCTLTAVGGAVVIVPRLSASSNTAFTVTGDIGATVNYVCIGRN